MRRFGFVAALGGLALVVSLFATWFDTTGTGWISYAPLEGAGPL